MTGLRLLLLLCLLAAGILVGVKLSVENDLLQALHLRRTQQHNSSSMTASDLEQLERFAHLRAAVYVKLISQRHLWYGLVVNRDLLHGSFLDECDSLLFSSLYYTALRNLYFEEEAQELWEAISKTQDENGEFLRHPRCRESLSRDMLTGLIVALTTLPPNSGPMLEKLIAKIDDSRGYFSDGPFYLSFLSPGLGQLLLKLARLEGLAEESLPIYLRFSFSSMEFDSLYFMPGFSSHLHALALFSEQQLARRTPGISSPLDLVEMLPIEPLQDITRQRTMWLAHNLQQVDPRNLFFAWIYERSLGPISAQKRYELLNQLLAMPEFPVGRLPCDGDRRSDYLWQRHSNGWDPSSKECRREFHGVDFVWMVSLLTSHL